MIGDYGILRLAAVLGAAWFSLGVLGLVTRQDRTVRLLSAGAMVFGVVLLITAAARFHGDPRGETLALLVLVLSTASTSFVAGVWRRPSHGSDMDVVSVEAAAGGAPGNANEQPAEPSTSAEQG